MRKQREGEQQIHSHHHYHVGNNPEMATCSCFGAGLLEIEWLPQICQDLSIARTVWPMEKNPQSISWSFAMLRHHHPNINGDLKLGTLPFNPYHNSMTKVKWGNVNIENHHHHHLHNCHKEQQIVGDKEGRTHLPHHCVSIITSECTTAQRMKSLALGQATKGRNPKGANSRPILLFSRKWEGECVLNKQDVWLQL